MKLGPITAVSIAAVAMLIGCSPVANLKYVDCATAQYEGLTPREAFPATPRLDCGFGDAVNMAIARQVVDPHAATRNARKDAAGMDGSAARDAIFNYQKSFRAPEPAPIGIIGIGTATGGGQ